MKHLHITFIWKKTGEKHEFSCELKEGQDWKEIYNSVKSKKKKMLSVWVVETMVKK